MVQVRVGTNPPVQGITIHLKAFDPDDPSAINDVVDDELLGGDNRDTGHTDTAELAATQLVTGEDGTAATAFRVAHQPGDNHRVAATMKAMTQGQPTLDGLTDNNVPPSGTNPATQAQVNLFVGHLSDLLTVWRKLHVEVDSMAAVDWSATDPNTSNAQANTIQAAPVFDPATNRATIEIEDLHADFEQTDQHRVGRIDIAGFGSFTTVNTIVSGVFTNNEKVVIINAPPTIVNANGAAYTLWDDDIGSDPDSEPPFQMVGLDAARVVLPKVPDTGLMAQVFQNAYVDVPPPDMQYYQGTTVFDRNVADGEAANKAKENRSLTSSADYWAVHVTSAFQGFVNKDNDPDTEQAAPDGLQYGVTKPTLLGFHRAGSLVYLETIRDDKRANVAAMGELERYTVAHGAGHQFLLEHPDGYWPPGDDEDPSGDFIMTNVTDQTGMAPNVAFSAISLKKVREASHPPQP